MPSINFHLLKYKIKKAIKFIVPAPILGFLMAIWGFLFMNPFDRAFIKHNQKMWKDWKQSNPEAEILVDAYYVAQTLIVYSYFANILAKKFNAKITVFSYGGMNNYAVKSVFRSFNTSSQLIVKLSGEQKKSSNH